MMTVNEVSKLTGISVRTLQYYDRIGLFKPSGHTTAGYRLYNTTSLDKRRRRQSFTGRVNLPPSSDIAEFDSLMLSIIQLKTI